MTAAVALAGDRDLADAVRIVTAYFDAIELLAEKRDVLHDVTGYLREPGGMWLARQADQVVGVIALRPLPAIAGGCEIRRLYVDPAHRGAGIADALLDAAETAAVARGYTVAYLDTMTHLRAAIAVYRRRGYEPCERYNDNPLATVFMRRQLQPARPTGSRARR